MWIAFGSRLLNLDAVTLINLNVTWRETHPRPTGKCYPDHTMICEDYEEAHTGIRVYTIGTDFPYRFDDADAHTAELRQALAQLASNSPPALLADVLPGGSYQDQRVFAGLPADLQAKIKEVQCPSSA